MRKSLRKYGAVLLASGGLALGGCGGGHHDTSAAGAPATAPAGAMAPAEQPAPAHHSVLGGAAAGAVGGHMLGHHAVLGAATGALIQHERNKHARRR